MQVRLTGEGDAGREGGPPGNLYVQIDVRQHNDFIRDGHDLVYRLPVNLAEATLGVEKQVPTLEGELQSLKVPEGTQPGAEFRIRSKGVPHLQSDRRGDLRVVVDLQVPRSINSKQRKLLEELSRSFDSPNGMDHAPDDPDTEEDKGLFGRIKEVLG